jgi:hypothetical protein
LKQLSVADATSAFGTSQHFAALQNLVRCLRMAGTAQAATIKLDLWGHAMGSSEI